MHKLLLWKTKTLLLLIYLYQTLIQALLSTADLPLRFLYCLLNSVALWGGPMVGTEGKSFEIKACRSLENAFLLNFSWNFKVSWGILKKSWLGRYIPFCMFVICNQKNKNNRWKVWKIYRVFQKQQKKHEETEFHHSIQDWVFTTVCRKVLANACTCTYLQSVKTKIYFKLANKI